MNTMALRSFILLCTIISCSLGTPHDLARFMPFFDDDNRNIFEHFEEKPARTTFCYYNFGAKYPSVKAEILNIDDRDRMMEYLRRFRHRTPALSYRYQEYFKEHQRPLTLMGTLTIDSLGKVIGNDALANDNNGFIDMVKSHMLRWTFEKREISLVYVLSFEPYRDKRSAAEY